MTSSKERSGFFPAHQSARCQKTVWAPVGWLSELKVGDIWQRGRKVHENSAETVDFTGLNISKDTATVVKAGISLDTGEFLLPIGAHPWHMKHTQSHCVMVDLLEGRRLVIPCVELIRFYFGSANTLLSRLFLPGLTRNSLVKKSAFNAVTGMLRLELQEGMSGYAASDVGRILRSSNALKAAAAIGGSLLQGSTQGRPAYPFTFFPFTGNTDLSVIGEWLPHGQQLERTFLVHSIQRCTRPFPFTRLSYTLDRPQSIRHIGHGQKRVYESAPALTHSQVGEPLTESVNKDPSSRFATKKWLSPHGVKFPDLVNKAVFRSVSEADLKQPSHGHARRRSQARGLAVGLTTGTSRPVGPMENDVVTPTLNTEQAPEFLREYLENLATIPEIDLAVMTDSHQDGWTIPVNALQDDDRTVDGRLFVAENGELRVRRACVLSVATAQRPLGKLVLIEGPPTFGKYLSGGPVSGDALAYCLEHGAFSFANDSRRSLRSVIKELYSIAIAP